MSGSDRNIEISKRLKSFPPYLFAEIDRQKALLRKQGVNFIDVSIGDPDVPAPGRVIDALYRASKIKENQKYALDQGKLILRKSISRWMRGRFGVELDPQGQILPLIGSKEGLIHFPLAFVNPGDYIIVPSPGYPGYKSAARLSGARIYELKLDEKNGFLPDLSDIPSGVCNKAKIIYLNYPNNPTTALCPLSFLRKLVAFCLRYNIILAYDNAYSEIYFDKKPESVFQVKGAEKIAVEFHSLSKTFCMTGFRIGWAAGAASLIGPLLKVKSNIDSGIFGAIQEAAVFALDKESVFVRNLRAEIKKRRDYFCLGLKDMGFNRIYADSTFYVWVSIPKGFRDSMEYSRHLLEDKGIIATPGVGFGKYGEGFIRFALTVGKPELERALKKLKK